MYVTNRNAVVVSRASHSQNTPHVSRPHSDADDERDAHEQHADLGAGAGEAIPAERVLAGEQVGRRRQGGDDEGQVGQPGRGRRAGRGCGRDSPWLMSAGDSHRPKAGARATPTRVAAPSTRVAWVPVVRTVDGAALAAGGRPVAVVLVTRSPTRR